ncbi:glycosyltransferase family 4 protein [Ramlibacter sp.]|uniref:glycosyltransferase family 4 protein n=1 Tax=Ramlibacter sp. TaxID=1917967 RepID=UPI003D1428B8
MKLTLVTDAWQPQVNGVVTTLVELVRELEGRGWQVLVIQPSLFRTWPCPGYAGIDLAIGAKKEVARRLEEFSPDAIHIATEGPLGWAARGYCVRRGLPFTTAFHTKFPEIAKAAAKVPVSWGYAVMRHFHRPSSGVMAPTRSVAKMLEQRGIENVREWTHGVDTDLFAYSPQPRIYPPLADLPRPISLFVGRVSYEKNIAAFLDLELPGSKVVCGVGPVEAHLKRKYPGAHWVGLLERPALAELYSCADVLVFTSFADTFGLVMLEAMACGTPVAAFRADGPTEVLSKMHPTGARPYGGYMHHDLKQAWEHALRTPREEARLRALDYSWQHTTERFVDFLVPTRGQFAGLTGALASR